MRNKNLKFKDELRHILLRYAFYPFAFFIIIVILAFYIIFIYMTKHDLQKYADQITSNINNVFLENEEYIKNFQISIDKYKKEANYRADINYSIFQFHLDSKKNTDIFIVDKNKKMLFCTNSDSRLSEVLYENLKWEIDKQEEQRFLLRRKNLQNTYSYFIMSKKKNDYYIVLASSVDLFDKIKSNYSILITDEYKSILFCSNPLLEKNFGKGYVIHEYNPKMICIEGAEYWYLNSKSKSGLIVTLLYDLNESINIIRNIVLFMVMSFVIITISILISTKIFADNKTKTIYQIIDFFGNKVNNNKKLIIESNDEFSIIAEQYNKMLDYQQKLSQKNIDIIKETHIAKIRQLESEFNPHFLFNTLENIRFMIKLNPNAAEQMVVYLSKLLRYSISKDDFVSLQDEITYTKYYLELLKFRFNDRLNYDIVPLNVEFYVPKLIIQPIIENSVRYSLDKKDFLNIKINIYEKDKNLYISVLDDGIGIEKNKLKEIIYNIENRIRGNHIGLSNLKKRIELIYGKTSDLKIISEEESFTEVILKLPLEKNDDINYS